MRDIRQSGIIKLYEIYENEQYIQLIMDYNKGIGLMNRMKSKPGYSESNVVTMIKSLMTTVSALHEIHVIHRNINPNDLIVV
jgi:serine/threonine protein kinase